MYSKEQYIILSKIFSLAVPGRFPKARFDRHLLFEVFKTTLKENTLIFAHATKRELVEKALEEIKKKKGKKFKEDAYAKKANDLINYLIEEFNEEEETRLAQKEIELATENNIKIITYVDADYPEHLKTLEYPPFVLYVKGRLPNAAEYKRSVAIIGTRYPDSQYGKKLAHKIGELIKNEAWYNISGLAAGCDEYGHIGSLGATGAILGQGLCTPIFPKENTKLAEDILANDGFLMSEVPPSTKLTSLLLVERDRLQSGLTKAVVVIETSHKSGTFHAINACLKADKKLFVIDPTDIEGHESIEAFKGNIAILNKEHKNIPITKALFEISKDNVIAIKKINELKPALEKISHIELLTPSSILEEKETIPPLKQNSFF